MGKKRTKGRSAPDTVASESAEPVCRHLRKGLEQGNLKKALVNVEWNICQDCKTDNKVKDKPEEEAEDPSVWLCLKCGHQGCGRDSQEQHALKHYTTPRSEPHYLVLSLDNWSVWCYKCDEEVKYCSSNRLGQVVDYVRKQAGVRTSKPEKNNGHIELENKKLEKESKNEQEREKSENLAKETIPMDSASQITVKGLSNLGNTCFFNAVMQNLSQTPVLRELLKEVKMSGTIVKIEPPDLALTEPLEVNLEPPGPLTLAMSQFLSEMQENKKRVVTPKELFSQVCKKATRFKGYQQQDSEEEKDDSYMKSRSDLPSGTSKHLQKKAKKQAKKQAKNQRRQQKIQERFLHFNELCATDYTEDNEREADTALAGEVEVDTDSTHGSQEEATQIELSVNQKDLDGQESMIERTPDVQESPEDLGVKSANTESDLGIVTPAPECPRDFNGAFLEERTSGELDIINGLKNLNLNAAVDPDEINIEIPNDSHSAPKVYEVMNEDPETAFCTLANREAFSTDECSIQHCLYQFTRNEKLQDANKLLCEVCSRRQCNGPKANIKGDRRHVYTNAKKQMLVSLAPPVLTLHLKRFQQAGFNLRKVNKHIKFPEILDLAPFCTLKCKNVAEESTRVLYSLYGVVEHSGTMRSGHYTAYAKERTASCHLSNLVLHGDIPQDCEMESTKGQWFHISDTHVQAVPITKVLNSQAYLLFYERIL